MKSKKIIARIEAGSMRLDKYIRILYPNLTQGIIEKMLRKKDLKVNNKSQKSNFRLNNGDEIEIYLPYIQNIAQPKEEEFDYKSKILAHKLLNDYCILNDDNILAINKPSELASQGGTNQFISVDSAINYLNSSTQDTINFGYRICHRLDKSTSGVFLIAKSRLAAQNLTEAFRMHHISKTYVAICDGIPKENSGIIVNKLSKNVAKKLQFVTSRDDLQGEIAETKYQLITASKDRSLIKFMPKTGRMHQIRVHAQYLGCPIYGDLKYNIKKSKQGDTLRLMLHALNVQIPEEIVGKKYNINATLPDYFAKAINKEFKYYDINELY
ncbi:MAG: RluA family pseudouridine synthase [Rickettsiaceae bacterium]|nr:RluA family pseudouridine synthase [Rickettsiaceae bacterium]